MAYTYDSVGNITSFTFTPSDTSQSAKSVYYTYNSSNQLTREDNQFANKTFVYFVTSTGNISSIQETAYTAPGTTPSNRQTVTDMAYDDWVWIDRVTEINGDAVTYDAIGNPTAIGDVSLLWEGRTLRQYADDTNVYNYIYDMSGRRTSKTLNGTQTKFYYEGNTLAAQQTGSDKLTFMYDAKGAAYGFFYGNNPYFYIRNLQGDIVGITDPFGNVIGTYVYDAWGNLIESASDLSDPIAQLNPLRYRGYYYDTETGYYFLNSRYYNPRTGRFLNADTSYVLSVQSNLYDKNLYAYCDNNPVVRKDSNGYAWETVFDVVSLGFSVAEVVANPIDPWAWAGLLGDVVDVVVPFVGGLGETVDVVKTASIVIDKGDDIIDVAKSIRRTASATDNIKHSTGAYVVLYEQGQHYIGKGGFNRAITSATEHLLKNNRVSAIIWAPTPSKESAFVTEYLLQSTFGLNKTNIKSYNMIWSPGKKLLNTFQ